MKTRFIVSSCILFFLLSNLNGTAQVPDLISKNKIPEFKTGVVGSYPTEVWEYNWVVSFWSIYQNKYISYTSFGEPEEITIIGQAGDSRTHYTYNASHEATEVLDQLKEAGVWVNNRREISEYDANGFIATQIVESWIGSDWVLSFGTKYQYSLNGDNVVGVLVKIWSREDNDWINSSNIIIAYSNDMSVIETVTQEWQGGAWKNSSLSRQVMVDDKISEVIMSGWIDEAWVQSTKFVYEYSDFDSFIMTLYTGTEDNWTPSQRFSENFDSHGNTTLSTVEIYAAGWIMLSGSEYLLTYDGDNLTQRITRVYSMTEPANQASTFVGTWRDSYKEDFKNFASLSTEPLVLGASSINYYPNPAREAAELNIDNLKNKSLTIDIMSLSGALCSTELVYVPDDEYHHTLNLEKLASGTFIIIVKDDAGKFISSLKLIHQK